MLPQVIHEWEKVAAAAVREGGEDDGLKTQMLRLAQAGSPSPAPAPECRSSHSHLGPRRTSTLARALTRLPYGLWPHHAAEALPLGRRRRGRSASSSCMPPRIRAPLSSSYCR